MMHKCIALLGRRDEPTDAVEEYCHYLGVGLCAIGFELQLVRVPWAERGWAAALQELKRSATEWRASCVLVQYTALAWSRRGFPLPFLRVLKILREASARVTVVFHDVEPHQGKRGIDKLRRQAHLRVMRESLRLCDLAIFTVPMEKLSWIRRHESKAVFIPVGANLNEPEEAWKGSRGSGRPPTNRHLRDHRREKRKRGSGPHYWNPGVPHKANWKGKACHFRKAFGIVQG
jgi:hypothetical protein